MDGLVSLEPRMAGSDPVSVGGFARRVLSPAYACRALAKFGDHAFEGCANAKAKSLAW